MILVIYLFFTLWYSTPIHGSQHHSNSVELPHQTETTALHIATYMNNLPWIEKEIRNKANPLTIDANHYAPIDLAQTPEALSLLCSSLYLFTFIQEAASKGHTRILATIFTTLNQTPVQQHTPLEFYNRDRHSNWIETGTDTRRYLYRLQVPSAN